MFESQQGDLLFSTLLINIIHLLRPLFKFREFHGKVA